MLPPFHNRVHSVLVFLALALLACAAEPPAALRVAVAQPLVCVGDVPQNIKNMQPLVTEAARRGAKLVVFSECGLTGYDLKGVGAKAALAPAAPELEQVAALAREHSVAIIAGFHERLNMAQIACNQSGYDAATGYFHCGGSSIVDRTGEATAVIAPRFVFEQLRPDLAVGLITRSSSKP